MTCHSTRVSLVEFEFTVFSVPGFSARHAKNDSLHSERYLRDATLNGGCACGAELGVTDPRDLHAADAVSRKANLLCSAVRKVETAATHERTTVIDANINGATVRKIG